MADDGSYYCKSPCCGAETTAHKHVIPCWRCGRMYTAGLQRDSQTRRETHDPSPSCDKMTTDSE